MLPGSRCSPSPLPYTPIRIWSPAQFHACFALFSCSKASITLIKQVLPPTPPTFRRFSQTCQRLPYFHIRPCCKINSRASTPVRILSRLCNFPALYWKPSWAVGGKKTNLGIKQTNMGKLISTWGSLPHECAGSWRRRASFPFFWQIEKGSVGFQWSDWKAERAAGRLTYFLTLDFHLSQANPRLMAGPGGARVGRCSHPKHSHTQRDTQ